MTAADRGTARLGLGWARWSSGRYRLFFEYRIGDVVRTAAFIAVVG